MQKGGAMRDECNVGRKQQRSCYLTAVPHKKLHALQTPRTLRRRLHAARRPLPAASPLLLRLLLLLMHILLLPTLLLLLR